MFLKQSADGGRIVRLWLQEEEYTKGEVIFDTYKLVAYFPFLPCDPSLTP